ncbi:class I adenylate-forming enzyme family protein [Micromonospora matsumotoense]|uniref:class I adenylate-forming enzyme family protein n=1 Tax=Micromonospora matsumotoense TaxID=121616 RepID=UPI0034200FC4
MAETGRRVAVATAANRPSLVYPVGRLDAMLTTAASSYPDRLAICSATRELRYRDFEQAVNRLASGLRSRFSGAAVALTSVLDPDFAVAYYAISRSGNRVAIVNPLLPAEVLTHVLSISGAAMLFATPALAGRLAAVRDRLPQLTDVLLIGPDSPADASGEGMALSRFVASLPPEPVASTPAVAEDDVAVVQFTSGTTGLPKGVLLSHRNVTVNAAQVAAAHHVTGSSVTFNHLPTFHPMHLNSAVCAGATQVLCDSQDVVDSVRLANRYGATHYYSLPVRLARLAVDPRLPGLRFETVTVIASGGSALSARATTRLAEHFAVPVIQGYGLAETSPLTHSDDPRRPQLSSVGLPVADTECRVVDVDSGSVVSTGEMGEVQVRGPQLMVGYLHQDEPATDADGWLATGDVGYLDEDGRLYLVDRIKDTFKCDNWLVAPSEIERVLERHPAVRECVVVDLPHEFSGAVAAAFVVPRPEADAADRPALAAEISAFVNAAVAPYQHVHRIAIVDEIPRSANGKIQRRDLRAAMLAHHNGR